MDKKILLSILAIVVILSFIMKVVFNFLEIPFYKYGIFIYWVIAIALLSVLLPQKSGEIFS